MAWTVHQVCQFRETKDLVFLMVTPIKELTEKVIQSIDDNNLIRTQRIIVGLSGGPDSVCLLHVLWCISEKYNIKLYPAHLNHMLRADEADQDEAFCVNFCDSMGLELKIWHRDIRKISLEKKMSTEEAAREERYSLFREYAKELGGASIAVAHNMNDQAETLLMRIIRGTGLDGLKGMEFYNDGIIRPLLSVPRSLIEAYNSANSIIPRIDSTNLHTDYTRNKIRLELFPYLKKLFDVDAVPALFRLSQTCTEDSRLLQKIIEEEYNNCIAEKTDLYTKLSTERLLALPKEALARILRKALEGYTRNLKGIEAVHIEQVKQLILKGRTGATVQLPYGIRASREYEAIKVFVESADTKQAKEPVYIRLDHPGEYKLPDNAALKVDYLSFEDYNNERKKVSQSSLVQYFDMNAAVNELILRNRQNGDIISPYGSKGSKKLKEYLIDEKIPKEIRDELLLLTAGREIIWIIGLRTSDKFKVNEKTINVIKIEKLI